LNNRVKNSQRFLHRIAYATTEIYDMRISRWRSNVKDLKKFIHTIECLFFLFWDHVSLQLTKEKEVFMISTDITWAPSVTV